MLDLEPATGVLAGLVTGVRDDQLTAATPCTEMSLGDLLGHVDGLALAFTAAAAKTPSDANGGPSADGSRPDDGWRSRVPERLTHLAAAWREDAAWTGMTRAGGVDLPGEVAGLVALNEVLVHGWDVAVASGQPFTADPQLVDAAYGFLQASAEKSPEGTPGLFGPPLPVPADAPLLDRVIGLSGRDPAWQTQPRG